MTVFESWISASIVLVTALTLAIFQIKGTYAFTGIK